MPSLSDPTTENAKIIYMGDSGHGKTGSKAALIAMGFKYMMIDTDNGFKILRSLLTDNRYPYAEYMKKHGIDPEKNISYIPIDVPVDFQTVTMNREQWNVLAPVSSKAWTQILQQLKEWKDGDRNFGPYTEWDNSYVLDFDTLSTLAELAYYFIQDLNSRLGALSDDHGRDNGSAQELLRRLMLKLSSPLVRCNVILTTHITWVDQTQGIAESINARLRDHKPVDPRGFPQAIGRQLPPVIGKRFNDMFICRRTGGGSTTERRIYTVPTDNVDAKHSVYLEQSYPLATGLAEIFSALLYRDPPLDLIETVKKHRNSSSAQANGQSSTGFGTAGRGGGGFGSRLNR